MIALASYLSPCNAVGLRRTGDPLDQGHPFHKAKSTLLDCIKSSELDRLLTRIVTGDDAVVSFGPTRSLGSVTHDECLPHGPCMVLVAERRDCKPCCWARAPSGVMPTRSPTGQVRDAAARLSPSPKAWPVFRCLAQVHSSRSEADACSPASSSLKGVTAREPRLTSAFLGWIRQSPLSPKTDVVLGPPLRTGGSHDTLKEVRTRAVTARDRYSL